MTRGSVESRGVVPVLQHPGYRYHSSVASERADVARARDFATRAVNGDVIRVLEYSSTRVLEYSSTRVLEYSSTLVLEYSSTRVEPYSSTLVLEYSSTRVLVAIEYYSSTRVLYSTVHDIVLSA